MTTGRRTLVFAMGWSASLCRGGRLRVALTLALIGAAVTGCAVNPVTGERQLQLVSEERERAIGEQQYRPAQQMSGGAFTADPALTAYVERVGQRVAAQAQRQFQWQFVVLDSSVPNAWALPGGKIAVNRGLLVELATEAELAAVLAHEVVHVDAGHGARAITRALLTQAAVLAATGWASDSQWAPYVVGSAQLAGQLVGARHGRDAERQADALGMRYMRAAGYDASAAVGLQETFLRLSASRDRHWLAGLFATHPPSAERLAASRMLLAQLDPGGTRGIATHRAATAGLRRLQPALEALDTARGALDRGDLITAGDQITAALRGHDGLAVLHETLGDVLHARGDATAARAAWTRALELTGGDYYAPLLKRGLSYFRARRFDAAQADLERSSRLLPVAPGLLVLGNIAERQGRVMAALGYYEEAAGGGGTAASEARTARARLDLWRNPGRYLRVDLVDGAALVVNRGPIAVRRFSIRYTYGDGAGRRVYEQPYERPVPSASRIRVDLPALDAVPVGASIGTATP